MKKLYLLLFLNGLAIASFTPFTTIYFLNIGYDLAFIALSSAIFNIAVTIAEIPFALVVDRYNPKLSLYFGFMLRIIGFYLFTVNFGVNYIILGYILTGVANAATSGPLGAMIMNNKQNQTYENIAIVKSRISLYGSISSLLGATIGYSLFNIEEYFIWIAAIIFLLLAMLLLVFMPKIKAEGADENSMFFVRGALKLFKMPVFYILIFLNIAAFWPLLAAPVKFNAISPNMLLFGHYAITFTSIVGSKLFMHLKFKLTSAKWLALVNILALIMFSFADNMFTILLTFSLVGISHLFLTLQIGGLFSSKIGNKIRACSSSVISLSDSLLLFIIAPIIGMLANYNLNYAILSSTLVYMIVGLIILFNNKLFKEAKI